MAPAGPIVHRRDQAETADVEDLNLASAGNHHLIGVLAILSHFRELAPRRTVGCPVPDIQRGSGLGMFLLELIERRLRDDPHSALRALGLLWLIRFAPFLRLHHLP